MKRFITFLTMLVVLTGCSLVQDSTRDQRTLIGFGLYFEKHLEPTPVVTFDTENFTYFLIDWDFIEQDEHTVEQFMNQGIIANEYSGFKNGRAWTFYENDVRTKIQFFADIDVNGMMDDTVIFRYYLILEEVDGTRIIEPIKNTNGQVQHDTGYTNIISFNADGVTYELNISAQFVNELISIESIEFNKDNTILKTVDITDLTQYTVEGDYIMIVETREDADGAISKNRQLIENFSSILYDEIIPETVSIGIIDGDKAIAQQRVIELNKSGN